MSNQMKRLAMVILVLFCTSVFAEIESVTVLNGQFQYLNKLTQESELSTFSSIWATKNEVEPATERNWSNSYKIDISGGTDSGRWLYHEGWIMLLRKASSKVYRIGQPEQLESALGLTPKKSVE